MTPRSLRQNCVWLCLFALSCIHVVHADDRPDPWLRLDGSVGSDRALARANLFAPLYDDGVGMVYLDIRGVLTDESTEEGNVGLGYRRLVDDRYIVGAYGFVDIRNSAYDNTLLQATVGAELISRHWELRLNGYIPDMEKKSVGPVGVDSATAVLHVSTTNVSLTADHTGLYEQAMWGADVEAGYTYYLRDLDLDPALDDLDVRLLAGWYHFENDGPDTASGPMGRVELNWRDPLGQSGWVLTVGAEGRSDDIRGEQGYLTASLHIPLGRLFGREPQPARSTIRDRMLMPVRRDVDIMSSTFEETSTETTPVYNNYGSMLVGGYYYTADGTGDGSFENPGSLSDALNLGENTLAVGVERGNGNVDEYATVQLLNGQVLAGAGTEITLQVPTSSGFADVTFYPVPGGNPAEDAPELIAMSGGGEDAFINLANNNHINGLTIDGAGTEAAIHGDGITNGMFTNSNDVIVSGTEGAIVLDGVYGDFIVHNTDFIAQGDDETGILVYDSHESTLTVTDSMFELANDSDGVFLQDSAMDLTIAGCSFSGDGTGDGVWVSYGNLDSRSIMVMDSTFTQIETGIYLRLDSTHVNLIVQDSTFSEIVDESIDVFAGEPEEDTDENTAEIVAFIANNIFELPDSSHVIDFDFDGSMADITIWKNSFDLDGMELSAIQLGLFNLEDTSRVVIADNTVTNGGDEESDDVFDFGLFSDLDISVSVQRNTINGGLQGITFDIGGDTNAVIFLGENTVNTSDTGNTDDDAIDFDIDDDAVVQVTTSANMVGNTSVAGGSAIDFDVEDDAQLTYTSINDTFTATHDDVIQIELDDDSTGTISISGLTLTGGNDTDANGIAINLLDSDASASLSLTNSTLTGATGVTDNDGVDLFGEGFTTVTISGVTISGWEDGIDIDDAVIGTEGSDFENDNTITGFDEEAVDR